MNANTPPESQPDSNGTFVESGSTEFHKLLSYLDELSHLRNPLDFYAIPFEMRRDMAEIYLDQRSPEKEIADVKKQYEQNCQDSFLRLLGKLQPEDRLKYMDNEFHKPNVYAAPGQGYPLSNQFDADPEKTLLTYAALLGGVNITTADEAVAFIKTLFEGSSVRLVLNLVGRQQYYFFRADN